MTIFIDRHPADALSPEVDQQFLQQSSERQVDPHVGVHLIDHWRDERHLYCVVEAPDAEAVYHYHADHGLPCDDLHVIESAPGEDDRLVRAAIEAIWHTRVLS
jgi:Protein of unknown function (DUF4242)